MTYILMEIYIQILADYQNSYGLLWEYFELYMVLVTIKRNEQATNHI